MEEPIVRVEHLSHRYSVQWAIRDINFDITENGTTTLATAGKYCDRDIDVHVEVPTVQPTQFVNVLEYADSLCDESDRWGSSLKICDYLCEESTKNPANYEILKEYIQIKKI